MFCKNCGKELKEGAKFCSSCGTEVNDTSSESNKSANVSYAAGYSYSPAKENNSTINQKALAVATIKCGNCGYIGPGEPARRMISMVLAWICVIIAWPITVIYFVSTSKYRCPNCKSTFIGVQNKDGIFTAHRSLAGRIVLIFFIVLVAIAVVGILLSIVLASLTTAREKGLDAQIESNLSSLRATGEVYYSNNNNSYSGFCNDPNTMSTLQTSSNLTDADGNTIKYTCNDSSDAYAATSPLKDGNYFCIDNLGTALEIDSDIGTGTACAN